MTLKEYLRQSNPKLDKLADEAEAQRTADEESAYEEKVNGGNDNDKV
jgi:hypothetical protein